MAITIITVGRKQNDAFSVLEDIYIRRISGKTESVYIKDRNSYKNRQNAVDEESADIIKRIKKSDYTVLLDSKGKMFTSVGFADILDRGSIVFIIGGIDGVNSTVRERADITVSFSKMTMPHQLARVFLLEQVYRAQTIRKGGKYHR